MSYRLLKPEGVGLLSRPAPYPLYPLSSAQPLPPDVPLTPLPTPAPASHGKKMLVGILVVVALLALLAWLDRREREEDGEEEEADERQRLQSNVRKQSTAQMAKNLYERLQERGGVSESTMRSLAQLSRNA